MTFWGDGEDYTRAKAQRRQGEKRREKKREAEEMNNLSHICTEYVKCEGASSAGIATLETLAGGPESVDLTYVMPEAKSTVVFAVPMDQASIPDYLSKKDRLAYEREYSVVNSLSSGIAVRLANFLSQKGHPAIPLAANDVYRDDTAHGRPDMMPPISLRYLAVAAGVGSFGFSGNVICETHGACIILGAVLTSAELTPTEPLNQDDNYCESCRMCMAVCPSGLMHKSKLTTVTMGGKTFSYAERLSYLRCRFVCGGRTGLHPSGRWSTWSPGRFPIPDNDEDFRQLFISSTEAYDKRPETEGGRYHSLMDSKLYSTCGNCQIVCTPDKEERKQRYRMLVNGGVVVQETSGDLLAVTPEEARRRLEKMPPDVRALYESD